MNGKYKQIIQEFEPMSNYYYNPQPTLIKQSSQILTPIPLQQQPSTHPVLRATLTDRSQHEVKNSYMTSPPVLLQPHIQREGSVPHLLEQHGTKHELHSGAQGRNLPNQNIRLFSDYQMVGAGRVEEAQLPSGGGYNITTNKLGEKVKNKTELHKSNSRNTLTPNDNNPKLSSTRMVDSINDDRDSRTEVVIEQLTGEMSRMAERLAQQEERIDRLQKSRREQTNATFTSPQMEEINKILSLVEKSQQRDDYKRTVRMIDELRGNILDLHSQVKQLQYPPETITNNLSETVKSIVSVQVKEGEAQMRRLLQADIAEIKQRAALLEMQWNEWKRHDEQLQQQRKEQQKAEDKQKLKQEAAGSSLRRFQGKMITLLYEERLNWLEAASVKSSPRGEEKENNNVLLTQKTYYLDSNGYLLDKNKFYLLNTNNEQIRLNEKEIALLKKHSIL